MKKSLVFALLIIFGMVLLPSDIVFAAGDYGLSQTAKTAGLAGESDLPTLVGNIIGTALSMISVLFFALVLYGGFLWMTSRGNSEQEKKAKDTIFGAVVGIIVILAAYAITNFVFSSLGPGANNGSSNAAQTSGSGTSGSGSSGSGSTSQTLKSNGEDCTSGSQCQSNTCVLVSPFQTTTCQPAGTAPSSAQGSTTKVASGGQCQYDADCQSGTCNLDGNSSPEENPNQTSYGLCQ